MRCGIDIEAAACTAVLELSPADPRQRIPDHYPLCGRFSPNTPPPPFGFATFVSQCHCTVCQNWTGAPYQWVVLFPADRASVTKGEDNIVITKTSDALDRARCKASSRTTQHGTARHRATRAAAIAGGAPGPRARH